MFWILEYDVFKPAALLYDITSELVQLSLATAAVSLIPRQRFSFVFVYLTFFFDCAKWKQDVLRRFTLSALTVSY